MPKQIPLSSGKFALVDDEDYGFLSHWRWYFNQCGYAVRQYRIPNCEQRVLIQMHRLINSTPDGFDTDHINGDRLDNRRENLRTCTRAQNLWNSFVRKKSGHFSSDFKGVGVQKLKGKNGLDRFVFYANITKEGVNTRLGNFYSEVDAAMAYNDAAKEMFGEFAQLNEIPEEAEDITNQIHGKAKELMQLYLKRNESLGIDGNGNKFLSEKYA